MKMNLSKAAVLVTVLVSNSAISSWVKTSDKDLYCGADVIVAGTLNDIKERYMSVTAGYGKDSLHWYMDLGYIQHAKLIKGGESYRQHYEVIFDSKGQGGPFSHMKLTHSAGESGIWVLSGRDSYTGYYRLSNPANPLPLSEEGNIRAILKENECE